MQIGFYAPTHGIPYRDDENLFLRSVPAQTLQTVQIAQKADAAGFHSMWCGDHVCMPRTTLRPHVANASGTRSYQERHEMMDAAIAMSAVAASTTSLRVATGVLIAPYRNPLHDARQFACIDVLSEGRLILGIGAGWAEEEFVALGVPFAERGKRTEECIEIYKRAWCDDPVAFDGTHYRFENLSMDPKPLQKPRPPIIYGGVAPAGARRAARHCDGFYPMFFDPQADPLRYAPLQDIIRQELAVAGRGPDSFSMSAAVSMRLTSANDPLAQRTKRPICTGTPEQVLEDLDRFARAGYSLAVGIFDCPSGEAKEYEEQAEWIGQDIIPQAAAIKADGGWQPLG